MCVCVRVYMYIVYVCVVSVSLTHFNLHAGHSMAHCDRLLYLHYLHRLPLLAFSPQNGDFPISARCVGNMLHTFTFTPLLHLHLGDARFLTFIRTRCCYLTIAIRWCCTVSQFLCSGMSVWLFSITTVNTYWYTTPPFFGSFYLNSCTQRCNTLV